MMEVSLMMREYEPILHFGEDDAGAQAIPPRPGAIGD
jgi:hypothetical protein